MMERCLRVFEEDVFRYFEFCRYLYVSVWGIEFRIPEGFQIRGGNYSFGVGLKIVGREVGRVRIFSLLLGM